MNDRAPDREMANVWSALRRRKVVQWGLVYVAAAWGFLQGLEYVGESFNWPQQVRQIAVLVLLIGLPIVLVFAWYHGDRGQQRIRPPNLRSSRCSFCSAAGRSGTTSAPATPLRPLRRLPQAQPQLRPTRQSQCCPS